MATDRDTHIRTPFMITATCTILMLEVDSNGQIQWMIPICEQNTSTTHSFQADGRVGVTCDIGAKSVVDRSVDRGIRQGKGRNDHVVDPLQC